MSRDAPPSRAEVTTSRTWADSVDVNTLTSSGMMAPASVPQLMTVEGFHQRLPSPRSGMRSQDAKYVRATDTIEVIHTRLVSGPSKFMREALPYCARVMASLTR